MRNSGTTKGVIPIHRTDPDDHKRKGGIILKAPHAKRYSSVSRQIKNHYLRKRTESNCDSSKILVIGSAHIDILADYDKKCAKHLDKIGDLNLTIGGSAYNIAVNLGQHNFDVALYTFLKKDSLSAKVIREAAKTNNIKCNFIHFSHQLPESGYVAHRNEGKLVSAVSCINIDKVAFNLSDLKKAIRSVEIVVIECNLSKLQISQIIEISRKEKKRLFVSSVSESKIDRAVSVLPNYNSYIYEVLSMNAKEAQEIIDDFDQCNEKFKVRCLCRQLRSSNVIITHGRKGYSIFTKKGDRYKFPAPKADVIKSEIGSGDALLAAVCAHASQNNPIKWDECPELIDTFVIPILGVQGATLGASKLRRLKF
jgi:sugar/nucleoside kinase (ribokinase family)